MKEVIFTNLKATANNDYTAFILHHFEGSIFLNKTSMLCKRQIFQENNFQTRKFSLIMEKKFGP